MTQLALPLECGYSPFMFNGYGRGDEALKAALHIQDHVSINNLRSDVNNGFHRVTDGQQQITKAIYDAENDVRTDLDSVKVQANQNSLHNLNATRESENHVSAAVNAGTMANLEATREVGQDLIGEICDVSKDALKTGHLLSSEIMGNRFFASQGFSDVRREIAKESCDTRQEILVNRHENDKAEARTRELILTQNQSIQKQIAECCCETKLLLQSQGSQIRELELKQSNSIRELQLATQNDAKQQIIDELRIKCRDSDNEGIKIQINQTNNLVSQLANLVNTIVVKGNHA